MSYDKNHKNNWTDQDVESFWDSVANIYVSENNKVKDAHDQRFAVALDYLDLRRDCHVLNISSRDCEANDYIMKAKPDCQVINAEISFALMEEATRLRPYVKQVKLESYGKLPFDDAMFTRVLSLETLEHVPDPLKFLEELHRVSTRDARLVLSCPPSTSEWPYRLYSFFFGGHGEGPHRFPASKEVKLMFEKTGWKLVLHKGTVLLPVGPRLIKKQAEHLIEKFQGTFISELGIRQFYVCQKY